MKKNLIITWPSHCFTENMPQIIYNIHKDYNIYYVFIDFDTPHYLFEELKELKKRGYLKEFYKISEFNNLYKHFQSLKKILHLRKINFDVWLAMNEVEMYHKFIKNIVLTNSCKKILVRTQITYLFNNTLLANKYLSNSDFKYSKQINIQKVIKIHILIYLQEVQ